MRIINEEKVKRILESEEVSIDLGCGGSIHGENTIGIDISSDTSADIIGNIAFEKLPFDNSSVDKIFIYDFIEHIPFMIWEPKEDGMSRKLVMIELFNEMYRVLKDNGSIIISVPFSDTGMFNREIFQDPTHASFWTPETFNYFTGNYYGFHDVYGHTSRFHKKSIIINGTHLLAEIVADKNTTGEYLVD